jgi:ATP-dependent Clp endopeptidase proteolytic subunit ClpP
MPKHAYRFRGSIEPSAEVKRPVRAELTVEVGDDGVGKLYLHDVIDSWGGYWGVSAKEFNTALAELGDVSDIHLHINSPGGEVYEGIAILNSLRRHQATVTAIVDGLAASAASFIAVGADHVVMGRNTEMMIHDAWGIVLGPAADMHHMGDRLDKISNNIASVYAAKAGGSDASWREHMLAETWYSAQEAVDAGLADKIEGEEIDPAAIENAFDLSVFKHAGRAEAPKPGTPSQEPEDSKIDGPAVRFAARRATGDRRARLDRRAPAA